MKNVVVIIISALIALFVGLIIGARNIIPASFFEINIYQVASLLFAIFASLYITYYLNNKNAKLKKIYDYTIKQCSELDDYIDENSYCIYQILEDFSKEEDRRKILLYFKALNSKIGILALLKTDINKNEIDSLKRTMEDYEKKITGDEWGRETKFEKTQIDGFKKDMVSARSIIQNIIAKCIKE